jgi:hypothetical protein
LWGRGIGNWLSDSREDGMAHAGNLEDRHGSQYGIDACAGQSRLAGIDSPTPF